MDIKSYFAEKLSKILFLEIKKDKLKEIFNVSSSESIYVPVSTDDIANKVKKGSSLDKIPLSFFIEGMFFVLGTDDKFRYNEYYKKALKNSDNNIKFIKNRIGYYVKKKKYEDAYILLKGLSRIEKTEDIYSKLLFLCDELRKKSSMYKDEEMDIIEEAKQIENFCDPYFYEALILNDIGDFQKALFSLNTFLAKGGKPTKEIIEFKTSLKMINDYEKGKSLVNEDPDLALKILLPLIDSLADSVQLFYYIAVAYRNLKNNLKAIYYLEKAMSIDDKVVEVINELGINYAAIGNYEKAILYFRSAFQYTGSVEICTNLIMCYLNTNNLNQAKAHLKLAKQIDPKDEIVVKLEKILNNLDK